MNVLVIGGSRFSGRKILQILDEKGHDITVINRGVAEESTGIPFLKNLKYQYPSKIKVIHLDRKNHEQIKDKLRNNDFEAIIDTCAFNERDIQSIINIASDKLEHYIFTSTGSVYDDNQEIQPISEDAPLGSEADDDPVPYSRDKRRAESILRKNFKETGFPFTIIRPTYIYGPYNYIYREAYFFDRIIDGKTIFMPGNGEYLLDFVHAFDVAWLLTIPLENKKAIGNAYNASGQGGLTLNNYCKMLFRIYEKTTEIRHYDPSILENDSLKPENQNQMFPFSFNEHFILSKEKAAIDLNYSPIQLEKGLAGAFYWYSENKNPQWHGDYTFDEKLVKLL
ncbi:MAG: NAD-dependent epimerase/dehydratase family protein [Candidatus Thorarchaeota archaeon]